MIDFKNLEFNIDNNKIYITKCGNLEHIKSGFAEVQIAGENKPSHQGIKMIPSSEGDKLTFVSYAENENVLEIIQSTNLVEVKTVFQVYEDSNAIRIQTVVTNISSETIVLEEVAAFAISGIGGADAVNKTESCFFTRFLQSHHMECQPRRYSFAELGLGNEAMNSQKRIAFANIGSWSTKEELPQAIIEDTETGNMIMFQIESNSSWYYEISDIEKQYYLYLSGANLPFGGWSVRMQPEESYTTPAVALAFGKNLNDLVGEMTKYRRHIAGKCIADTDLPTIFNEYMHLSWDSPTAENTAIYAPVVAKTGVEYYVIDCGWHNEEDGDKVYPYVGQWKESFARFSKGLRKTMNEIQALGMKPGLWIEPEIVGIKCEEMLQYYDDDCFMQRNGKRLSINNRHFLDYRNQKVRNYMSETIRRMVEEYGAAYIKFDYNQDCGLGTELNAFTVGKGLEECADAFLEWVKEMKVRFPNVIFEGCSSGGMRMDYKTLSVFSLVSTSDQIDYLKYPYIVGNILSAVLPEQAAVWSYPVAIDCDQGEDVTDKRIVLNMINSFLGRMHLASHLEKLNEHQMSLIKEGVDYYKRLSEMKKRAVPYFPNGFTSFGKTNVSAGLKDGEKVYLAVWNLLEDGRGVSKTNVGVHIPEKVKDVRIAYPSVTSAKVEITPNGLNVCFQENLSAVFLEIEIF